MPRTLRTLLAVTLSTLIVGLGAFASVPAHADDGPDKILLMLDASGSMNAKDPSGSTKIEAAKKALTAAVGTLPAQAEVGLRVYGATQPGGKPTPAACADTQLVHPIGPLDKAGLTAAIAGFVAKGETPIAHSLQEGLKDLGATGKRHIILVSDGEESCVPDPCPVVRELVGSGVSLQIDTVGFAVNATARKQLQCIAAAGNGTYYDADDSDQLTSSLSRLSTRAARPFTTSGTPVTGTPDAAGAPVLAVGQYTDKVEGSSQGAVDRFYRITRTLPGSTLRVNVAGRLPAGFGVEGLKRGQWDYRLTTDQGVECDKRWDSGGDTRGFGMIITGTTLALGLDPRTAAPREDAKACANATGFLLQVTRAVDRIATSVPVEIRVLEEPPVTNLESLPGGITDIPKQPAKPLPAASTNPTRVVAGAAFSDALMLEPGSYETEVVPGELVFVKTRLDWGQSAAFVVDGPDPSSPSVTRRTLFDHLEVDAHVFAPDFSQMDTPEYQTPSIFVTTQGKVSRWGDPEIDLVPDVRYRNRWDSPALYFGKSRGYSMAGDYYYAIGVAQQNSATTGVPVPIRFTIAVDGAVTGVPTFAASQTATANPTATPSPTPTASPDGARDAGGPVSSPVLWVGGGLVAAAAAIGGYAFLRRRSGTR